LAQNLRTAAAVVLASPPCVRAPPVVLHGPVPDGFVHQLAISGVVLAAETVTGGGPGGKLTAKQRYAAQMAAAAAAAAAATEGE
jgi:hypothetical protein